MHETYLIWIGDRITDIDNFNDINFHDYLANRAIIIVKMIGEIGSMAEKDLLKRRMEVSGGTILEFNPLEGISLVDFKPFGTDNVDSWENAHLKAAVNFGGKQVSRVWYQTPKTRAVLSARVLTSSGSYMISYNLEKIGRTYELFNKFIQAVKPFRSFNRVIQSSQETIIPDNDSTSSIPNINLPSVNVPTRTNSNAGLSAAATVGGLAGIVAEAGIGLAVDAAINSIG